MLEKRSAKLFIAVVAASAFGFALLATPGFAQVQDKTQQGCINAMNKSGQKVLKTQGKENSSCIKDAGKDKLEGTDAQSCLTLDRKGKVAKATGKTSDGETKKCIGGSLPDFGYTDSATVNAASIDQEVGLTADVFGANLSFVLSTDKVIAGCQAGVNKAYEKVSATVYKEYNSCKKDGLKEETLIDAAGLVACVGVDPKGKVGKAAGKVGDTITKKCEGVTLSAAFPGSCSGDAGSASALADCINDAVDCRACRAIEEADGIFVGCDDFDDGVANGSCAQCGNGILDEGEECDLGLGNDDSTPDTCRTTCVNAFCGDGVVDLVEECDDGNNTPGDGCDAQCECDSGNPDPKCQDQACPTSGELILYAATTGIVCASNGDCLVGTCDTGLSRCVTETTLDTGSHGLAIGSDTNDQVPVRADLLCSGPFDGVSPEPCGQCLVKGIDPSTGDCRCSNDTRTSCDEPFQSDADDCGGATCDCFFGPPLPLSAGNAPACALNQFAVDISGTADVDTGEGEVNASLATVVFLGINVLQPCPSCDGDVTIGDGVRDGTCNGGRNDGETCDTGARNESFPGPSGGGMSLDCLPDIGKNVSGTGLKIALDSTTGSVSLPLPSVPCGTAFFPQLCVCGLCTGDLSIPCSSDAECAAESAGTCSALSLDTNVDAVTPNKCSDGVCSDVGGGNGSCLAGPTDTFCDGIVAANGSGYIQCNTNLDCTIPGSGNCALPKLRPCFVDPISATGVADPNFPVGVSAFCVGPTANGGINAVAGLPGPTRIKNVTSATSFCASDPGTAYTPGTGGCP